MQGKKMVGRASVTQELGSPAPSLFELSSNHTRRSSSRASRRTTREPETQPSALARSSYSLPVTPVTTTFEESLLSAKHRRRPGSESHDDRPLRIKGSIETSQQIGTLSSARIPDSSSQKSHRSRNPDKQNGESGQTQSTLHTFLLKKPLGRRKSLATQAELTEKNDKPGPGTPASETPHSGGRKTRKSMPVKMNGSASLETSATKPPVTTPRVSTPQPSGRDRKSKDSSVQPSEKKTSKPTPRMRPQRTPAAKADKEPQVSSKEDISNSVTPQSRAAPSSRTRRSRKSAPDLANPGQDRAISEDNMEVDSKYSVVDNSSKKRSRPNRLSNTITLSVGRKALESVLPATLDTMSYDREIADSVEATPLHVYGDNFHFDYDTDMYRNNFGLDGQIDTPASPTSFATSTSTAARASGRTRKPTIRALESFESERRYRRARTKTPAKVDAPAGEGRDSNKVNGGHRKETPPTSVPTQNGPTLQAAPTSDVAAIASRLIELTAAALAPGFEPSPEAERWLEELQKEFEQRKTAQTTSGKARSGGESMQPSNKSSFLGSAQPSKPWTDKDGWLHTGQVNKFGEECIVISSDYEWYRPNNTYGDDQLPLPPVRLKSREQLEKDRIFGFPPRMGERNLPRKTYLPFTLENVDEEKAKIKAREEARQRGLVFDRSMSCAEIKTLIRQHDIAGTSLPSNGPPTSVYPRENTKVTRSSRKRRLVDDTPQTKTTQNSATESTDTAHKRKRRRKYMAGASVADSSNTAGSGEAKESGETADPNETEDGERRPPQERSPIMLKLYLTNRDEEKKKQKQTEKEKQTATKEDETKSRRSRKSTQAQSEKDKKKEALPKTSTLKKRPHSEVEADVQLEKSHKAKKTAHSETEANQPTKTDKSKKSSHMKIKANSGQLAKVNKSKPHAHSTTEISSAPAKATNLQKRQHAEHEANKSQSSEKSPKSLKLSFTRSSDSPGKFTLTQNTPKKDSREQKREEKTEAVVTPDTSAAAGTGMTMTPTPGGRPRRRAAAALMAEFETHAQERARRANARKKGNTPPKKPNEADHVDQPGNKT
ncbi:putative GPI-anchored cell surface glycoprotein [Aspergillus tanneri]|uniref:GPI-anchored cell surface glycoprotein n=1 Tax=Aspergillus tanneri TaxID=1220188 RepID=A0A5M9MUD0_9EURO|nr:uncharacterized protein ATNIH1004_004864 [Aspergillus tanneri]KAA8648974.1 hypothetical protein ATNIH1004_004864 [Aspergillus tanneri]